MDTTLNVVTNVKAPPPGQASEETRKLWDQVRAMQQQLDAMARGGVQRGTGEIEATEDRLKDILDRYRSSLDRDLGSSQASRMADSGGLNDLRTRESSLGTELEVNRRRQDEIRRKPGGRTTDDPDDATYEDLVLRRQEEMNRLQEREKEILDEKFEIEKELHRIREEEWKQKQASALQAQKDLQDQQRMRGEREAQDRFEMEQDVRRKVKEKMEQDVANARRQGEQEAQNRFNLDEKIREEMRKKGLGDPSKKKPDPKDPRRDQAGGSGMGLDVGALGRAGGKLAGLDRSLFADALSGGAGLLVGAVGGAGAGMMASQLVQAPMQVASGMSNTVSRLGQYSGPLATQMGLAEARSTMGDIRRAQMLGPELAGFTKAQSKLEQASLDVLARAVLPLIPKITFLIEESNGFLERNPNIGTSVSKELMYALSSGGLLDSIIDIANTAGAHIPKMKEIIEKIYAATQVKKKDDDRLFLDEMISLFGKGKMGP